MSSADGGGSFSFFGSDRASIRTLGAPARDAVLYEVRFRTALLSLCRPLRACRDCAVAANSVCPVGLAVFPCPRWTFRSLLAHLPACLSCFVCCLAAYSFFMLTFRFRVPSKCICCSLISLSGLP